MSMQKFTVTCDGTGLTNISLLYLLLGEAYCSLVEEPTVAYRYPVGVVGVARPTVHFRRKKPPEVPRAR